jgi:hypothetical protein
LIIICALILVSGHAIAACVDGFNPKSGKPCGGGDDGGGEPETATCTDVFFGGTSGLCTAAGTENECIVSRFNDNTPGWRATQDCDLRATLVTPAGNPIFDGQGYTFNLVGTWSGEYAGFSNGEGDYRIANITVNVASTDVAAGCDDVAPVTTVQTAIWIDQDAPNSGVPRPQAAGVTITSGNGAHFCNAIEYRGSDPQIRVPQFAGGIAGSTIAGGSYERAAIWLSDLNLTDNVKGQPKTWDHALASDNMIEGSCTLGSVGIIFGPNVERGRVEGNTIVPNGSGCGTDIGILVSDSGRARENSDNYDFLASNPITVGRNVIVTDTSGGSFGVVFDADSEATTDANDLTAGHVSDTGFCVETGAGVDLGNGKKADSFSGFGTDVATPANC